MLPYLILGLFMLLVGKRVSKKVNAQPREANTADEQGNSQSPAVTPETKIPEARDGANAANQPAQKSKRPRWNDQRWQTVFTGIITLITAIYATAAVYQWLAMERQSDLAREQLNALFVERRAYLGVKSVTITPLVTGQSPTVSMVFVNGGGTPAYGFRAQLRVVLDAHEPFPSYNMESQWNDALDDGRWVFLTSGMETRVDLQNTFVATKEILADIESRRLLLMVIGESRYSGIEGYLDVRRFCYIWLPATNNFAECHMGER